MVRSCGTWSAAPLCPSKFLLLARAAVIKEGTILAGRQWKWWCFQKICRRFNPSRHHFKGWERISCQHDFGWERLRYVLPYQDIFSRDGWVMDWWSSRGRQLVVGGRSSLDCRQTSPSHPWQLPAHRPRRRLGQSTLRAGEGGALWDATGDPTTRGVGNRWNLRKPDNLHSWPFAGCCFPALNVHKRETTAAFVSGPPQLILSKLSGCTWLIPTLTGLIVFMIML